ncbi:MAG TPA: glycosylase, partial [Flavisolibacter sp.]|nr:glycosylase [Flavisolibacter sp.]
MVKKQFIFLLLFCGFATALFAQSSVKVVPEAKMRDVYNEVKTPFKYGMVIVPQNDTQKIDCPTVFRKGKMWYMLYIVFNGNGYETWLSKSKDLLNWQSIGRLLSEGKDSAQWDAYQKAGYLSLVSPEWSGSYALQSYNKKYWMSYFGGNAKGYEAGLLSLGMAYTKKNPTKAHEWEKLEKPVLTSLDSNVRWWENKKLFKSTIVWDKAKLTGYPFVMYYNANGDTAKDNKKTRWFERIGMAVSGDMIHWTRFNTEPVVHHPVGITG